MRNMLRLSRFPERDGAVEALTPEVFASSRHLQQICLALGDFTSRFGEDVSEQLADRHEQQRHFAEIQYRYLCDPQTVDELMTGPKDREFLASNQEEMDRVRFSQVALKYQLVQYKKYAEPQGMAQAYQMHIAGLDLIPVHEQAIPYGPISHAALHFVDNSARPSETNHLAALVRYTFADPAFGRMEYELGMGIGWQNGFPGNVRGWRTFVERGSTLSQEEQYDAYFREQDSHIRTAELEQLTELIAKRPL